MSHEYNEDDPLSKALRPPPDETQTECEARLASEAKAKEMSDIIDEELEKQKLAERKGPKAIKVLLLGQSESGKSTTLKNFQILYEPKAFRSERASWRAVIQLNVVRSIHLILDAITRAQNNAPSTTSRDSLRGPSIGPDLLKLKLRLSPLLQVEQFLTSRLTAVGSGESEPTQLTYSRNFKELAINSTMQWKGAFARLMTGEKESSDDSSDVEPVSDPNDPNDPGNILHACSDDMISLWSNEVVQELLDIQNLRLEEMAGFFLDSLPRVTSPNYIPTDDDILRARLKTLGVTEHRFTITHGASLGRVWKVFDVGGHRSQRAAWVPYFDDMDAIIFLAPISCFDQVLAEDIKVNRLDSVKLWSAIVSNELLKNTNLILFLNKIDIMKAKLAAGIKLSKYVVSYADRPNDFDHTSVYLRKKFAGISKEKSLLPRPFYCHLTSVTDTKSTKYILSNIKDMLMRRNLAESALLT
ncbi:guanine nucleotide binding protein, alpha subunit [Collybia nuda]|uniref:Guanine nucleotide binding protein, alpha subunit n=1 Tax=Collybia nuda TaxID=64659 RepID=A0A9P5YA68_9AGAR|nr:guanine nucleotide binding protein, alpha subunit [Collybia nuda]